MNRTVQIWTGKGWKAAGTAFADVDLYPRQHLLPDGKVFEDGYNPNSQRRLDPAKEAMGWGASSRPPRRSCAGAGGAAE